MADRVSVMSWLEGLAQDDWRQYHSDSEVQEIARRALALFEEQEPVVPGTSYDRPVCGACGYHLIYMDCYCPRYGRRVKW